MDNWTVSDVTGHAGVIGQYIILQMQLFHHSKLNWQQLWGLNIGFAR